jgi:hypothetical protein
MTMAERDAELIEPAMSFVKPKCVAGQATLGSRDPLAPNRADRGVTWYRPRQLVPVDPCRSRGRGIRRDDG